MPILRLPDNTDTSSSELAEGCPSCGGKEWLRKDPNAAPGQPDFGKIVPCPNCYAQVLEERKRQEFLQLSGLDGFGNLTFDSFDASVEGVEDAFRLAREFAANPSGWLILTGSYGCGKTHLAAAVANEIKTGLYFAVVPDLLDYLRAAFDPNRSAGDSGYDERFEMVRNIPVLILDDLGTENQSIWVKQAMFQLINHRYNKRLPTVITTNDYTRSEPRVIDRLFDQAICQWVEVKADSYRLRAKAARK